MFGFFKKKPQTAMDALIRAIYGDNPPPKSANLVQSVSLAYSGLLSEHVDFSEVQDTAKALFEGPIPYSTHDLAASVALNFFKRPELFAQLQECQLEARLKVAGWVKEGKVAGPLALSFEQVLYQRYKPRHESDEDGVDDLKSRFAMFKTQNRGKTPQFAAMAVRDFMVWQNNSAEAEKLLKDDFSESPSEDRVKMAFMFGAAGTALDAFSLPSEDVDLFLQNVIGMYFGYDDAYEIYNELNKMSEASNEDSESTGVGGGLMMFYLVHGKQEGYESRLASLIGL